MTKEVEIDISGKELAQELWRVDTVEQISFLIELERMYRYNLSSSTQLESLSDEIKEYYDTSEKDLIIGFLEKVLEYIRGAE